MHLDLILNCGQPRLTLLQCVLVAYVLLKLPIQTLINLIIKILILKYHQSLVFNND